MFLPRFRWLLIAGSIAVLPADGLEFKHHLLETFCPRWQEIHKELACLQQQMKSLPVIPVEDCGGTRGVQTRRLADIPKDNEDPCRIDVQWNKPKEIDLVVLVPSRTYDEFGVDKQYGLPEDFTVWLLDATGREIHCVARERNVWSQPTREGYPFFYKVKPAVWAAGLRICGERLHCYKNRPRYGRRMAWAEALCFSGSRNVAYHADVAEEPPGIQHWKWRSDFLVDGMTPLGIPEVPVSVQHIKSIGWSSYQKTNINEEIQIQIDLGTAQPLDAVKLYPTKRLRLNGLTGFGFPKRFKIEVAGVEGNTIQTVYEHIESDIENPGDNPVLFSFPPCRGRFVRIVATRLWQESVYYPAFLGFSEIEVLSNGRNLARGAPVSVSDRPGIIPADHGMVWSETSLTDGYGTRGILLNERRWYELLNQRLLIKTQACLLEKEADTMKTTCGKYINLFTGSAGLTGAFLLVFLPLRYRSLKTRYKKDIRRQMANDLHDDIGSNLGSIQMLSEAAERKPESIPRYLATIRLLAADCVASARNMVWIMRSNKIELSDWDSRIRETADIMLDRLQWTLRVDPKICRYRLDEGALRHLFLFYREALHNIIRHANCTEVEISLHQENGRLTFCIKDNGSGIDAKKLKRPTTLCSLKHRAAALCAELEIESPSDSGTMLTLRLPA